MKKWLVVFLIMLFCFSFVSAGKIKNDLSNKLEITDKTEIIRVIVSTEQKLTLMDNLALRIKGINIDNQYKFGNSFSTKLNKEQIKELELDEKVSSIEEDYLVKTTLSRSSTQIDARNVWLNDINGNNIDVAIIDTGIDNDNPYLSVIKEVDFTGEGTDDLNGHGTHVAGIVNSNHDVYKGIAYGSNLIDIKILNQYGQGYASDVLNGIEWAVKNNVDVISMSLGASINVCDGTDIISQAANWASDNGVIVVVAAGNEGPNIGTITSPGCAEKVITVGAVDDYNEITLFSGRGPTADGRIKPDLVAPGLTITSTYKDGNFATLSGTSMATPHVSGSVALLLEVNPNLSPSEIKYILKNNAIDLDYDSNTQGSGLINAYDSYFYVYNLTYPEIPEEPMNETLPNNETEVEEPDNETVIEKPDKPERNNSLGELPGLRRGQNKTIKKIPPGQVKKLENNLNENTEETSKESSSQDQSSESSSSDSESSSSSTSNSNGNSGQGNSGSSSSSVNKGNSESSNGRGRGLTGRVIYWMQNLFN